jgi:hypothetical protein
MKHWMSLAIALVAAPVAAQQQSSKISASNGVVVDVVGDDFASRYE